MPLLPYRRFEVLTAKTPLEVEAALRAVVGSPRRLAMGPATHPFEGVVNPAGFSLQPVVSGRNSFRPEIQGAVTAASDGSRIIVTMRLHRVVLLFTVLWMGGMAMACATELVRALRGGGTASAALGTGLMFLFGWILAAGGFSFEQGKAEELLGGVLSAHPGSAVPADEPLTSR